MMTPTHECSTEPGLLADGLRTIAARIIKHEETLADGRLLLAFAERAASLESELAEVREKAEAVVIGLNDPLNAIQDLVQTLGRRPIRLVDDRRV